MHMQFYQGVALRQKPKPEKGITSNHWLKKQRQNVKIHKRMKTRKGQIKEAGKVKPVIEDKEKAIVDLRCFRISVPTDEELLQFEGYHAHCAKCRQTKCLHPVDNVTACGMTSCEGCGFTYHQCKAQEHALTCLEERVACINACYGCPHFMRRSRLSTHLPVCPASVVCCGEEWNRWPMYTKEKGLKHSIPPVKTYIDCGQLDVALAMRDQRMLFDSLRAPTKLKRTLRNPLTQKYPAAPLTQRNVTQELPDQVTSGDRSQTVSDDDTDAPWDLSRRQPGLKESISSQLFSVSKETKEELMTLLKNENPSKPSPLTIDNEEMHKQTSSQYLTSTSNATQCQITKNAKSQEHSKENALSDSYCSSQMRFERRSESPVTNDSRSRSVSVVRDLGGSQLERILGLKLGDDSDNKDICLHKVLGVNVTHDVINKYCSKFASMYTFICAQSFRRDQYQWHFRNVHQDIMAQIDGYLEQRCPLAYAGCTFSFQRLVPNQPNAMLHFSSLLESFGLKSTMDPCRPSYSSHCPKNDITLGDDEKQSNTAACNSNSSKSGSNINTEPSISDLARIDQEFDQLKVDFADEYGKMHQQANNPQNQQTSTSIHPVLYTADNPDSKVLLVYNIEETCDQSLPSFSLDHLPFEVLQQIARRLDSFSLCNLSLTCCLLRDVCCSLLDDRGIVTLNWQRKKIKEKVSWEVVDKRWMFSTCFEPIESWKFNSDHVTIADHLKVCPFNQDKQEHTNAPQICFLQGE